MKSWQKIKGSPEDSEKINEAYQIGEPEYFFAVRKLGILKPGDYWEAYQIELMAVKNGNIVKRWMYDKPDTKQMVMAKMELMINPDNPEIPDDAKI